MPLQHGGLAFKIKNQFTGDYKEQYSKAFMNMIQNAIMIKCISYDSLAGYIFTINIKEIDAVFLNLDKTNQYTIPVTNILVKFALITKKKNEYETNISGVGIKHTMIKTDFENEKNIQLAIYKKTLEIGMPICPSIIHYDVIPENTNSELLTIFDKKVQEQRNMDLTKLVMTEIMSYKNVADVGIIGMEYANGYTTFYNYSEIINDKTQKIDIYKSPDYVNHCTCIANIIINIIRLFISTGTIHKDLHNGNIMVNIEEHKSLLIDFGFYTKIIDTHECKDDINVDIYSVIYNKATNKVTRDAIVKFLILQLGKSYNKITDEQGFMQTYLFDMSDEIRIKKIIKLFILIIMCDLTLNHIRLKRRIIMMRDFLLFIGFDIKTTNKGDFFSKKNIDDINNDKKSVDDWISENIKEETRIDNKTFFKQIFTEALIQIKELYSINDNAINVIGLDEESDNNNKKRNADYSYGKTTIGSEESKQSEELKNSNRALYTENKPPEEARNIFSWGNTDAAVNNAYALEKRSKQLPEVSPFGIFEFSNSKGGNQTKYKRKKNSKIKKHKKNKRTKKNV